MYITSFIHRQELLDIAERWFWGRPDAGDALRLTKIMICDGYVVGETLNSIIDRLLEIVHRPPFTKRRIRCKGELRDAICRSNRPHSPRVLTLFERYEKAREFYYVESPINGIMCQDSSGCIIGSCRIKRPRRIAEKANRRIAQWIFKTVQEEARTMAELRAVISGVPLRELQTSEQEMIREFVEAEERIAASFREASIRFNRRDITINDVGGVKVIGEPEDLPVIEADLRSDPVIRIGEREDFRGDYEATSLIMDIPWNAELICRKFRDGRNWEKYINRGISESELKRGLEPMLEGAEPRIKIELMLSTFDAMVESEFGSSIHEERIIAQRDNKVYKGYIPMNVEFLLEYLFAVGFSPETDIEPPPIKLWGRYLPETLVTYIRRLFKLPEYDFFY